MDAAADDLLTQAFTDPAGALEVAAAALLTAAPVGRIELLRVLGNACRELRRIDDSRRHLEAAVDEAIVLGDARLEGLASMSLAATLTYSGDFARARQLGARAVDLLEGDDRVAAESQRAGVLARAGRHDEALVAFTAGLDRMSSSTDPTLAADLLMNRGVLHGWAGDIDAAEADTTSALRLLEECGFTKRAVDLRHNLAWLAARRGDLVESFRRFDDAERHYEAIGLTGATVFPDRAEALLAAGLSGEAVEVAASAVDGLRAQGDDVDLAEVLMLLARATLLAGVPDRAAIAAAEAVDHFREQGRDGWWAAAASLLVDARLSAGIATADDRVAIRAVIEATEAAGLRVASAEARVLAAELMLSVGDLDPLDTSLDSIDRAALGWAARCRLDTVRVRWAVLAGDPAGAVAIAAAAADEADDVVAALGGTELRAHVTRHAAALVAAALDASVDDDDAAAVLGWSERLRAAALTAPPVRPPDDPILATDLDHLRSALADLDTAVRDGDDVSAAVVRCDDLRDRVRRGSRHASGVGRVGARSGAELPDGLAMWVSYVESRGRLLAVRLGVDGADLVDLGSVADAEHESALLRGTLSMHLRAVGRGVARDPAVVLASAAETARRLLDPLELPPGPIGLSPIGTLHDVPWGVLPPLRDRGFVVAPSLRLWQRCHDVPLGELRRVVAVAGPDVPFADDEVARVASCYPTASQVHRDAATVDAVGRVIAGADVAHLVCHGRFSADNPMFSSLLLADGPMFVYDLERISPPPRVVVLSACSAGAHARPVGTEVLGVTASLLGSGPRAVIASTVPVPDVPATVEVMVAFHAAMAAGDGPADALRHARAVDAVIGGALTCHGAG